MNYNNECSSHSETENIIRFPEPLSAPVILIPQELGLKLLAQLERLETLERMLAKKSDDDKSLSVKDAAARLNISTSTLYKLAEQRSIASCKIGRRLTFRLCDLDDYLLRRRLNSYDDARKEVENS